MFSEFHLQDWDSFSKHVRTVFTEKYEALVLAQRYDAQSLFKTETSHCKIEYQND